MTEIIKLDTGKDRLAFEIWALVRGLDITPNNSCGYENVATLDHWMRWNRPRPGEDAEFEIRQEGMTVAATFGQRERALAEARHYAAMYGQDGPAEIVEIVKVQGVDDAKQTD